MLMKKPAFEDKKEAKNGPYYNVYRIRSRCIGSNIVLAADIYSNSLLQEIP